MQKNTDTSTPLRPDTPPSDDFEEASIRSYHLRLLKKAPQRELHEAITTPIFTMPVLNHIKNKLSEDSEKPFPQYGLLAGISESQCENTEGGVPIRLNREDPRVFFNTSSPSSIFICGSQGSGKSHTLSCLLENCLFPSGASVLPHPLTGLVFHYDTFISDSRGSPCEAAYLASNENVKVRVLCSPSNLETIKVSQVVVYRIALY